MITAGRCLAILVLCALGAVDAIEAQQIRVQNTRPLRFRTVVAGYPTSVSRLSNQAARITFRGQANAEVQAVWTLPANIFHVTQGDPMPISFGSDDAGYGDRQQPASMTGWDPSTTLITRLSNNGRKYFRLGGTVSPVFNQRVGNYSGQVALTLTYTGN